MGRLRVFISSTMKDLANERRAIERQLTAFNIEPVNAESWLPDGTKSWERIEKEIRASDVFVLIVGERYGWIPEAGPGSGSGRSVTHLEFEAACRLKLPVLPFLKELSYETEKSSDDAILRDKFRAEITAWDDGQFIAKFEDAFDLADKVGLAVIELLTSRFQREQIRLRAPAVSAAAHDLEGERGRLPPPATPVLPPRLIQAVASRDAVLFAGSGVSLAAGLPSAAFFAQSLVKIVRESVPGYEANPVGSAFAGVATDVEGLAGRPGLVSAVADLVRSPQGLSPTRAHVAAVKLFNLILTTNYDMLFEEADRLDGSGRLVISSEIDDVALPERAIVNIHGRADTPESLVLTEREILLMDQERPHLWRALRDLLSRKIVVVVGSSLRDPSIVRLFSAAGPSVSGYFVVPEFWETTVARLRGWNLECIRSDADSFFGALETRCALRA